MISVLEFSMETSACKIVGASSLKHLRTISRNLESLVVALLWKLISHFRLFFNNVDYEKNKALRLAL